MQRPNHRRGATARSYPTPAERMEAPKYEDPGGPPTPPAPSEYLSASGSVLPFTQPTPQPVSFLPPQTLGETVRSLQSFSYPLPSPDIIPYFKLHMASATDASGQVTEMVRIAVPRALYFVV